MHKDVAVTLVELEAEGRSGITEIRRRSCSVCGGAKAIAGSLGA